MSLRRRRVVTGRFAVIGEGWVVAARVRCLLRSRDEVLRALLLLGPGLGGQQAIGLRPEELGPRRSIRHGAGPRPLWRSTVAMVVADTSIPSFRSLPSDAEVAPPGFSRPSRRIRCLSCGSSGGRPGGLQGRPRRHRKSRCHRTRVSGPTRKLLHRSRERSWAAAARNARSAVMKRGRVPPRTRIFSWWRSTTVSSSSSSRPHRTSRRSSQHRSR